MRRSVEKVILSKWQNEGRGARVRRSIGRSELRYLILYKFSILKFIELYVVNVIDRHVKISDRGRPAYVEIRPGSRLSPIERPVDQ